MTHPSLPPLHTKNNSILLDKRKSSRSQMKLIPTAKNPPDEDQIPLSSTKVETLMCTEPLLPTLTQKKRKEDMIKKSYLQ